MTHTPKVAILKSRMGAGGGLEKYALRTAQAFADRGCQVTLLTSGDLPANVSPNVNAVSLCPASKISVWHLHHFDAAVGQWLQTYPQDVVFGADRNATQTHYRAGNGIHAAYLDRRRREEGKWKALSFRLNPLHRKILSLEKATFEGPHLRRLFTNSAMVKDEVHRYYTIPHENITVIHNGVEWEEMAHDFAQWEKEKNGLFSRLGLSPDIYTLLFIGHGFGRKGLGHLLHALHRVESPFQLAVVGKDKKAAAFQSLARSLGLEGQVRFYGPRSDVRSFYQVSDALVIPTLYDPFANVTVEALAMGVNVVSSKDNGGMEVLSPETGIVVDDVTHPELFAQALDEIMTRPKTATSAVSARNSVRHLDFQRQLDTMVNLTLQN